MMPFISVIIPVYNAEKTICKCLDSLLDSQNEDIEIILINDGSTDKTGNICGEYASKSKSVSYYEKDNGGVSTARNYGLDKAKGKYITFVDSDDYVSPDYFETIKNHINNSQCDMIQFSYMVFNKNNNRSRSFKPAIYKGRDQLLPEIIKSICNKRINGPCAKVYRRDIIEKYQIRFPLGASIAEDRVFNIKYSFYINSYCASEKVIYYVNTENENSLSRKKQKSIKQQIEKTTEYFTQSLDEAPISNDEKEKYIEAMNFGSCRSVYHDAKLMHKDKINWLQRQKRINLLCKKINEKKMKYPNSLYCNLITIPVRLNMTIIIDMLAWKLTH